ncbi:hypothetical protein CG419_03795 [Latilactobacillus curvatus]|uniref:Uncharacterized protein n=1 Tax=Latilactobacillus curvatus TaxID=28038 RepID=A0AAC9UKB4_LATCU|nr:hypothetical protein [Latilactobacillus curvatus]ASN59798.1 hypothetical protein CG419_03795 [Latilactobacillus curvatus]
MEITEAQLEALIDRKLAERLATNIRNMAWKSLREEIDAFCEKRVKTNVIAKRSGSLRDAISTLIRFNVDCRNVASIDDEQADKARELFESIKGFI